MWASGHNGDIKRAIRLGPQTRGGDGGVREELAMAIGSGNPASFIF